jgi:hypothetical protein
MGGVDARFLYDGLYHTMLVHVVVELLVSGDPDAYERQLESTETYSLFFWTTTM